MMRMTTNMVLIVVILISCFTRVQADPLTDYQEAHAIYLDAVACMAAYSNRYGGLALAGLRREGWEAQYFNIEKNQADAKFVLLKKVDAESGQITYLLAVAGTETGKDVRTDFKFSKVYFAGDNTSEFEDKASEKNIDDSLPKVHMGFHQVVQTALTADIQEGPGEEYLPHYLQNHPEQKIILTGHSLGGAAAVLGGARLLSLGIQPEQIQVVTFGAPAVGNAAFARLLDNRLNVTRLVMSGDQITGILQNVIGGYVQFGRAMTWPAPEHIVMHPHYMTVYLDAALRNYYQKRWQAVQAGFLNFPRQDVTTGANIYVVPPHNSLPEQLQGDFSYMAEIVQDEYRSTFPGYTLAEGQDDLMVSLRKAAAAGCQWLVITDIQGDLLKNKDDVYFLTLQQMVFSVADGKLTSEQSTGSNTQNLTPLVAMLHNARTLRDQEPGYLTGTNNTPQ